MIGIHPGRSARKDVRVLVPMADYISVCVRFNKRRDRKTRIHASGALGKAPRDG
jgi:hypothetical protein